MFDVLIIIVVLADIVIVGCVGYFLVKWIFKNREPKEGKFVIHAKNSKMTLRCKLSNRLYTDSSLEVTVRGIRVMFPATFPHIIIDSHVNDEIIGGLIRQPKESQRVELEGNFYRSFALYTPNVTRTEALAIVTPDVMQVLYESGESYDIEFKGRQMTIMTRKDVFNNGVQEQLVIFTEAFSKQVAEQVLPNIGRKLKYPRLKFNDSQALKVGRRAFRAVPSFVVISWVIMMGIATFYMLNELRMGHYTPGTEVSSFLRGYAYLQLYFIAFGTLVWYEFRDPKRK